MALVSSVPFHLKNLISMYDYFQVKTNGTPRKCWCIVFSCKKRLKISIFVYFAPCWPYQTSTFPQEVQEHVQRCGEAASNSRHGCVSAKRSGAAPQNVDQLQIKIRRENIQRIHRIQRLHREYKKAQGWEDLEHARSAGGRGAQCQWKLLGER